MEVLRAVTPAPIRSAARRYRIGRAFQRDVVTREEFDAYRAELKRLWPVIDEAYERWAGSTRGVVVRGHQASFAHLSPISSERLYALLRKARPEVLVETGVCNGVSTSVILQALEANGSGRLHSVDLPEFADVPSAQHWEGKGGGVIPRGHDPGWLVPDELRGRWKLTIGRSQEVLPPLLERLGQIDFFMHDSEHSYECMDFEMRQAEQHLAPGAPLVVDDANWSSAFADFVRLRGLRSWDLDGGTYLTVMPSPDTDPLASGDPVQNE